MSFLRDTNEVLVQDLCNFLTLSKTIQAKKIRAHIYIYTRLSGYLLLAVNNLSDAR